MKKRTQHGKSLVCFLGDCYSKEATLIGGYVVPKSELAKLGTEIVRVKSLFGLTAIDPAKWNLADRGYEITRKKVGDRVDELRHQMFKITRKVHISLIMSWVWKGGSFLRASQR